MKEKPWLKDITADDMPNEELRILASFCGVEFVIHLMEQASGLNINIPKFPFRKLKEKYILENCNGEKASAIKFAMECDVTVKHVYNILRKKKGNTK